MDTTSYIALSRQMALDRQMTALANNVANAATTGFQAEHTLFEAVLERAGPPKRLAFVQDVGQWRDTSPGPIQATGNALDIAIEGDGYLAFETESGVRYGRGGHLEIDAQGRLTDAQGHAVLDEGGQPITLPGDDRQITIAGDGTVANRAGVVGKLQRATFANPHMLRREGHGLLRADAPPQPAGAEIRVVQGALEGSNVKPVIEMTSMMQATRLFEGTQRLLDTQHEIDRKAIDAMIAASSR
jgi:flagellar basal-body rod protein FlgF